MATLEVRHYDQLLVWDRYSINQELRCYNITSFVRPIDKSSWTSFTTTILPTKNGLFTTCKTNSTSLYSMNANVTQLYSSSTFLISKSGEESASLMSYDGSPLSIKQFTDTTSLAVMNIYHKCLFPTSTMLTVLPNRPIKKQFKYEGYTVSKVLNKKRCLNDTAKLVVAQKQIQLGVKAQASIIAKDQQPDTLNIYFGECLSPSDAMYSSNYKIPTITVAVPFGEYCEFFEIDDEDEIDTIYYKPFGIQYDTKKIYGRIIVNAEFQMLVKLKSGFYIKLEVKPFKTKLYKAVMS